MTSTVLPAWASAAATLTVVVVFPTPPFWFATVMHPGVRRSRDRAAAERDPLARVGGDGRGQGRLPVGSGHRRGDLGAHLGVVVGWGRPCGPLGCRRGSPAGCRWLCVALRRVASTAAVGRLARRVRRALGGVSAGDVSRETRSGAGQPNGVVVGPERRGKPRPGAAVRVSATSIAELTPSPSSWSRGDAHTTSPVLNTPKRHGVRWTTRAERRPVDTTHPTGLTVDAPGDVADGEGPVRGCSASCAVHAGIAASSDAAGLRPGWPA